MVRHCVRGILLAGSLLTAYAAQAKAESSPPRREIGSLVLENIPEIPAQLKERLTQYENIRSASLQGWLAGDAGLLISTRFGEASQLHSVKAPLSIRRQLTFYPEPVGQATLSPKGDRIAFLKDQGGDENSQIYLTDPAATQFQMITDGSSRNDAPLWDKSGRVLAFSSSKRNGRDTDVYIYRLDAAAKGPELLLQEGGFWRAVDFSQDGQKLLLSKVISSTENYLYVYDFKAKQLEQLFPGQKQAFGDAVFAKDGRSIFLTSDARGEFKVLYAYQLSDRSLRPISQSIPWDVESVELAPNGQRLLFKTNEDGINRLYLADAKSLKIEAIKGVPASQIGRHAFHPSNDQLIALTLASAAMPGDVYVYDLKKKQFTAWTESETAGLERKNFVEPRLIHYPSFDQIDGAPRKIPAFVYIPAQSGSGKVPVVINIHGGPEAQYRPGFSAFFQYLASERGIAVIAPNVRGSSGYGKTYLTLDNGFQREDSVKDIGALLDWIGKEEGLDSQRVAVMGGSYGGYMTLASLVHFGPRLAGGIDSVGISHFISFLSNTKSYRQDLRRVEYGDERDPKMRAFLEQISPLTQVAKIQKPLFVIQGQNDPRVPASEAEQIVKAVRETGNEAWYLLAKDEGHGFRKKANQAVSLQTSVMFLDKILLSPKTSANP